MAIQFRVPQHIEMEDRIAGPLTMAQFVWLAGGSIAIYSFFLLFSNWFAWLLTIPTALLVFAMAFIRVNEQPFSRFLGYLFAYSLRPRKRIWRKVGTLPEIEVADRRLRHPTRRPPSPSPGEIKGRLRELVHELELEGWKKGGGERALIRSVPEVRAAPPEVARAAPKR